MSWPNAMLMMSLATEHLNAHGRFVIYGPFMQDHHYRSPHDQAFDAYLSAEDPSQGLRDVCHIQQHMSEAGYSLHASIDMPAHNLMLVFSAIPA